MSNRHVQPTPTAITPDEAADARWLDDGGPTYEPTPAHNAKHWLRISAALTHRLPPMAARQDVIVTCEPGTRSGAPAAFYPTTATLEIDADLFGPLPPASINPAREGDEERYPAAWGALVHEAAHAAHSAWTAPPALLGSAANEAAMMLEESRAERAHLTRRSEDRRFLRACIHTLILSDFTARNTATRWHAAQAAALVLARRDAGILDHDETEVLSQAVTTVLGQDLLDTLSTIWTAAHSCPDTDGHTMLDHGRAWCQALGADPSAPEPQTNASSKLAKALAEAVTTVLSNVTSNDAETAAINAAATARRQAKAEQAERDRNAARTAAQVFASAPTCSSSSPVTGQRQPTAPEKTAAAALARALRAAAYRERVETTTTSATPPGRLSMRGALARDAQRAAGATPTAELWIHTRRRHTPNPSLRVGIAVDVSGSMSAATAPIASAAWIVAQATALTDPDSRTATIAYNRTLTAITAPGRRAPAHVTEFASRGWGHNLADAVEALRSALELDRPGHGRLLVIASDGYYTHDETARAAQCVKALAASGCAILWLAFAPGPTPLPGTTLLQLTDPADAHAAIAKAATTAIANSNHP